MFNRRNIFEIASAIAGLAVAGGSKTAEAKSGLLPIDITPRGEVGHLKRLPTVDLESKHDFLTGMMQFINSDVSKASRERMNKLAKVAGYEANQDVPIEAAHKIFGEDPVVNTRLRMWSSVHNHEHYLLDEAFHADGDAYLAEMEAAEKVGPGSIKLDPSLKIPEYCRYEIHQQPGGYCGNPFAGHIYHYATNQFYRGANDQDERHLGYAKDCPSPADGKVLRILDLGCGIGQLATSMKNRFPNAEVHAIDVAAPMIRYGHMRAVDMGSEIHFKQALAENTGYPDGHFDIVISYILFHEVTKEAAPKIISEVGRILRPGGVFYPMDFNHVPAPQPSRIYNTWLDHRWNSEPWRLQWVGVDVDAAMRQAGLVPDNKSTAGQTFGKITGTKSA